MSENDTLSRLGIANAYIKALEDRVAELEAQNAQLQSELDHTKARAKELEAETLRLEDLAKHRGKLMTQAVDQSRDLEARVAELETRCKRLEEAGDQMADWNMNERNLGCDPELADKWQQAKEAKP